MHRADISFYAAYCRQILRQKAAAALLDGLAAPPALQVSIC
ncbi:hypothetical protein DFAR_3970011 [Desulfarculales bacterium]